MMRGWRETDGSVAVEAAVIAPVLLALMLVVVYAGRASQADADVAAAAARASRAAVAAADPASAVQRAEATAAANLHTAGIDCQDSHVTVDTGDFRAGGQVAVTVSCRVSNHDLALVAVPGARWSQATSTHVIDTHRGGG